MKNILFKVWGFVKRRWLLVSILVIILLVVVLLFSKGNGAISTVAVTRGSVVSLVNITGQVRPPQSLDMAFLQGGRIAKIYVSVGDKVSAGQTLAHLENADLVAQVAQAEASVKSQQAQLDELVNGTRPETLQSKKAELDQAKALLASYQTNAINVLNDAYAKSDDAVRKQTDGMFNNDNSNYPTLTFSSGDAQAVIDAQSLRVSAGSELSKWQTELLQLQSGFTSDSIDAALASGQNHLTVIRNFLQRVSDALESPIGISAATVDSYKLNVNTGRTNVNTASTNITSQQQLIVSQKLSVDKIQSDYDLLVAGSTPEQIASQQAQVDEAKANALYQEALYEKTLIRAPFDGTVTRLPFRQGDTVTISDAVVSLVGTGKMQIEGSVAETDISRVKIGESAQVTLDAYGPNVIFDAKVIKIDLSATALEGVATYKTTLEFNQMDSRILPGLTANVDILSDKRDNVLYIPTRDVVEQEGKKYANVLVNAEDKQTKQVEITTGLRGSDGKTEITSGLNEGDSVVAE